MSLRGISIDTFKLPPLRWAVRRVYARFFERQPRGNRDGGVYSSYADAMQQTPKNALVGFENREAANKYRYRIHELTVSEYPALLWISGLIDQQQRRFFDLGGHFGLFYYALQRYRRLAADLRWRVCSLLAVIQPGKEWAMDHDPSRRLCSTTPPQHHWAGCVADPRDTAVSRLFAGRPARQAGTAAGLSLQDLD
jgi:hypothetical protein